MTQEARQASYDRALTAIEGAIDVAATQLALDVLHERARPALEHAEVVRRLAEAHGRMTKEGAE